MTFTPCMNEDHPADCIEARIYIFHSPDGPYFAGLCGNRYPWPISRPLGDDSLGDIANHIDDPTGHADVAKKIVVRGIKQLLEVADFDPSFDRENILFGLRIALEKYSEGLDALEDG